MNRMPVKKISAVAVAAAIASMFGASGVMAQGFTLEEVVVTARKKEETLQDVPVAVSNFSANDLKSLNLTDTAQLGDFSPGVNIEPPPAQGGTATRVTIRGQVQTDNLITLDPSVGWYIDDVYIARTYGTAVSMFDVERVEMLKGPQGTLYGRNTTGGAIKLVTTKADPSEPLSGYVTGGLGSFEQQKIGGAVNVPVIADKLAVRVVALKDENKEGYGEVSIYDAGISAATFTGVTQEDWGTKDNELYRIGATLLATDKLTTYLNYEHNESYATTVSYNTSAETGFQGDLPTAGGGGMLGVTPLTRSSDDFWDAAANALPEAESESDTLSLTFEYDLTDDVQTKLVYGWRETDSQFNSDIDGTAVNFSYFAAPFTSGAEQQSVEWQFTGSLYDGAVDWIAGVYWFDEEGFDDSQSATAFSGGVSSDFSAEAENNSQSIFGSTTFHITDTVNLTTGIRYTEDDKSVAVIADRSTSTPAAPSCLFAPGSGLPNQNDATCGWGDDEKYYFISYNVGVDWAINDDVMAYVKTSSASRSGGQNLRAMNIETAEPFIEETATDIELGLKSQLFDNMLQVNTALYHTDYEDVQQTVLQNINGVNITQVVNAGEADIDGVEVDFKWLVTDTFMVTGSAGLLNWNFKDDASMLPAAPEHEYGLRFNYLVPSEMGDFNFDLNYSYRGQMFSNSSGGRQSVREYEALVVKSVELIGARITWDMAATDATVALFGQNLTNEEYYMTGLGINSAIWQSTNSTVGAPRTFGIEGTYRF